MSIGLHNLQNAPKSTKAKKRVGRGLGSGHGTYSTRGMKGQRSRSGGSKGLKLKGIKQMLLRIPKNKGFKSIHAKAIVINLDNIEKKFNNGDLINPAVLLKAGLIKNSELKSKIKILAKGEVSKAFKFENCLVSLSALSKIEKAGGSIVK